MKEAADLVFSLSEGIPGATVVLLDYRNAYGEEKLIKLAKKFAVLGWKGSKIWVLYKDLCKSDLKTFHTLFSVADMFTEEAVSKGMEILRREGLA